MLTAFLVFEDRDKEFGKRIELYLVQRGWTVCRHAGQTDEPMEALASPILLILTSDEAAEPRIIEVARQSGIHETRLGIVFLGDLKATEIEAGSLARMNGAVRIRLSAGTTDFELSELETALLKIARGSEGQPGETGAGPRDD